MEDGGWGPGTIGVMPGRVSPVKDSNQFLNLRPRLGHPQRTPVAPAPCPARPTLPRKARCTQWLLALGGEAEGRWRFGQFALHRRKGPSFGGPFPDSDFQWVPCRVALEIASTGFSSSR
jgi:hypothetical protein